MSIAEEHQQAASMAIDQLQGISAELAQLGERLQQEVIPAVTSACGEDPNNPAGRDALHSVRHQVEKTEEARGHVDLAIEQLMIYRGNI